MRETIFVPHGIALRRVITKLMSWRIDPRRPLTITLEQGEVGRTLDQNAKLRAMERDIAAFTGEDPDNMHEILLAQRFGTENVKLGKGRSMDRPSRRSSDLTKAEFAEYITWVQAFAARELGLELV